MRGEKRTGGARAPPRSIDRRCWARPRSRPHPHCRRDNEVHATELGFGCLFPAPKRNAFHVVRSRCLGGDHRLRDGEDTREHSAGPGAVRPLESFCFVHMVLSAGNSPTSAIESCKGPRYDAALPAWAMKNSQPEYGTQYFASSHPT